MVEVSRTAKENGNRQVLLENKFANAVLYNIFRGKKFSTCGIVSSVEQTKTPCLSVLKYSTAHWQLSVNI